MEVLIAFTLAAVVLGSLVYGVAAAIRSDLRAKSNRSALRLAHSQLEAAGVDRPLHPGKLEGEINGYRWQQLTSKVTPPLVGAAANSKSATPPVAELYWVEVVVMGDNGTDVRLATSKIATVAQ